MTQAAQAISAGREPASLVDGEYPLTAEDFRLLADLMHRTAGISLPQSKAPLVYSRLAKRLRACRLSSFKDYCKLVTSEAGADEQRNMLAALTTNVTRFFREPHHFEHLAAQVIAPMAAAVRAGAPLRLWSAGCSSGQEPYSMAFAVLRAIPEAADLDVRILASDIDPNVVAAGRAGVYSEVEVEAVPSDCRARWLEADGEGRWRVSEAAKQLVAFRELNLIGEWPMKRSFQAIFCRNVAIYFDEPTQDELWRRFAQLLPTGGRLYVGHSERVNAPCYRGDGLTSYRRVSEARA